MHDSPAHSRRQGTKDFVGFQVGAIDYAIDIHRIAEVIRPLPLVALPDMPMGTAGVAEFRGRMIPVVDLRLRFCTSVASSSRHARWIVVTDGMRLVALAVDRVTEVFGYQAAKPREVPEIIQSSGRKAIASAYHYRGHLVFVVAVDELIDVTRKLDLPAIDSGSSLDQEERR